MSGERALEAARKLADCELIRTLEELVAGWQRDPKSPRHHRELGCNPRTNAGAIYQVTDLAASFRAADCEQQRGSRADGGRDG